MGSLICPPSTLSAHIRLLILPCAALFVASLVQAQATNDATALQKRGIEHYERCRDAFARSSRPPSVTAPSLPPACTLELKEAEQDLTESSKLFDVRRQYAAECFGTIKLAKVEGLLQNSERKTSLLVYAVQLAKLSGEPSSEAQALTNLAGWENQLGQATVAQKHVNDAIRIAGQEQRDDDLANALDVAGEVETKLNNYVSAGEYLNRALEKSSEIKDPFLLFNLYYDRGFVWSSRGQQCDYRREFKLCLQEIEAARADYKKAAEVAQQKGYIFWVDTANSELTLLDPLHNVLQTMESTATQLGQSNFQIEKASQVIYHDHFSPGPNPSLAATGRAMMQQYGLTPSMANISALYMEGQVLEWEGHNDAALTSYLKAVDLVEKDRTRLRDEESRTSLVEDKVDIYYAAILELLDHKRAAEAFELMERSRSRVMVDLLSNRPPNLGSTVEGSLLTQATKLSAAIGAEQSNLMKWSQDSGAHKDEIAQSEARISTLQERDRQLQAQIAENAPRLKNLLQAKLVSLEQTQAQARSGQYDLVYYLVFRTNLVIWHIDGNGVEVKDVFFSSDLVNKSVTALRESMTRADAKFDERSSRELFLQAVNPLLKSIGTRHLIIVPHEGLNLLPFQVLQDPADGSYLGERFQITYAPSATVLAGLAHLPNIAGRRLLAVADPRMSDSVAEVRDIATFYPGTKPVTDAIRNDELKKLATDHDILHLSMHGEFDARDPMSSYLLLRPLTAQDDGRFTAADMFGLPLSKNSMVVLSACETGIVTATHGNELMGMERALLYAGASTLVLTSWKVHAPSTALWMETFYREGQSKTPGEAARLALIAVKNDPKYAHPFYWAPFLLTGK